MQEFTYARQALIDSVGMVYPEDAYSGSEFADNAVVQAARHVGGIYKAKWQQDGVDLDNAQQVYDAAEAEIVAISPCPNEGCGSRRLYIMKTEDTAAPFTFTAPAPWCRNCDIPSGDDIT